MVGTRVYIGGLPYGTREKDVERFFRNYGRFRDVLIKNGYGFVEFDDHRDADDAVYELNGKEIMGERITVERARGTPRGSDKWRYGDPGGRGDGGGGRGGGYRDSGRGSDMNRFSRSSNNYQQSMPRYGRPSRTDNRLIVENLSSRVSWQDLKDYMRQAGEVTYADAHKLRRNEGVVDFASYSDMKSAIDKLDDTELSGRRIRLIEDKRSRRRSRSSSSKSRSRSRSRSRRRSRTRSRSRRSSRSRSRRSSRSKSRGHSKSKSKSPRRSISPSKSKERTSRERSRGNRSRSRSVSKHSKSRTRSHSPVNGDKSPYEKKDD